MSTKRVVRKKRKRRAGLKEQVGAITKYTKSKLTYVKEHPIITLGYATWILWYLLIIIFVLSLIPMIVGWFGVAMPDVKTPTKIAGGIAGILGLTAGGLTIVSIAAHLTVSFLVKQKLEKAGHKKNNILWYIFAYHWAM